MNTKYINSNSRRYSEHTGNCSIDCSFEVIYMHVSVCMYKSFFNLQKLFISSVIKEINFNIQGWH